MRPLRALQVLLATATLACAAGGEQSVDTTRWVEELVLQDGIFDVEGGEATGLWLASRGLYRREGERWAPVEGTGGRVLRALAVREAAAPTGTEVWAVGLGGVALRGGASGFEELRVADGLQGLHHVQASAAQVWVSGATDRLWRYDGSSFSEVRPPEFEGHTIGGLYATGGALFFHAPAASTGQPLTLGRSDGARWTLERLGKGWRYAGSIGGSGPTDVWAVGMKGKLFGKGGFIVHFDGQRWSDVPIPVDLPLTDVSVRGPDEAWAVGWKGTLLRWDGRAWTKVDTGIDKHFTRVHVSDAGELRVVLDDRTLLRWTGGKP